MTTTMMSLRQATVVLVRRRSPLAPPPCWVQHSECIMAMRSPLARSFSSSSSTTTPSQADDKKPSSPQENSAVKKEIVWLYKRTPDQLTRPRAILGISCFHTFYWSWYALDFMPAINQSPAEQLHIDPVVGYVGLMFSFFISLGAVLYPKSLVSGIGLQYNKSTEGEEKPPELIVASHALPWVTPATMGSLYDIGGVVMDPASHETKRILDKGNLGEYQGFVALKAGRRRLPFLLQIQDSREVLDSSMLLQVLVNPENAVKELQRRDQHTTTVTSESNKKMHGTRPKKDARGRKFRRR